MGISMKVFAKNKRAKFDYELKEQFYAGISLLGTEVKSIKNGDVDLTSSYVVIDKDGNAQWLNGKVKKYEFQTQGSHEESRTRQLLLHRKEIKKIASAIAEKRYTVVPYAIGATNKGHIKLELYLAKGKNVKDKRETIKKRDQERESSRY